MEDIIDIIVTETTNLIEITSQPTDEIIDVNIIDNREDITLNVTPSIVEININSLTGNFGVNWGDITGTLSDQTDLNTALGLKADLVDGKVPSSQLPSYVDDIIEVATYSALPAIGETGKIYVVLDTNLIYRWSGSAYIEIKDSSAVWGAITGTLSSQTDLQSALNAKDAVLTFSSPLSRSTNTVSIPAATSSVNGYLSSTDWTTFNSKQPALSGTGFVKISGTTISYDNSTYLTTSDAASTYLPLTGGTLSGILRVDSALRIKSGSTNGILLETYSTNELRVRVTPASTTYDMNLIFPSASRNYTFPNATGTLALTSDLSAYQPLLTNPVTGTGTSGILARFSGTSTITDSTIYDNSTRVSIGADVTTTNKLTVVASATNSYAVVAQASGTANGFWATLSGTGEIFRGQTSGGSYFIINNGGNAFLNGNLNVGDFASTSYRLNVVGTANLTGALSGTSATFSGQAQTSLLYSTDGTRNIYVNPAADFGNGSLPTIQVASNHALQFATNNTLRLTIASTGAATFSNSVTAGGNITISNSDARIIGGDASGRLLIANNNTSSYVICNGSSAGNSIDIVTNSYLTFTTGSGYSERMRITSSGSVGIGTTSPFTQGTNAVGLEVAGSSYGQFFVSANSATVRAGFMARNPTSDVYIASITNSPLLFGTNDTERMRITSAGNVGIGTTSPTTYSLAGRHLELNDAGGGYSFIHNNTTNVKSFFAADNADGSAGLFTYSNHFLKFGTNNTERMRITSGGALLIGQTTASGSSNGIYFRPGIESGFIVTSDIALQLGRLGTTGDIQSFYTGTTRVGTISVSGSATSYNTTSDYRLKQDLKSFNGIELVNKINTYNYEWKADNTRSYGVLAHELAEILPYAVMGEKDGETMQGVDYSKIVPVMVQAIKDLKAELDTLKNK